MRFSGRGHPNVRATHAKTLEFSVDADITARATCVVAVDVDAEPPAPMAGPIRVAIGRTFRLDAIANPSWTPGTSAVIRRSALRLPGTFATEATAASSDLPRDLVAALHEADALVSIDVIARPDPTRTVVLFAADPSTGADPRLAAELERADQVIAEDIDARRLVPPQERDGDGVRTLVVATRDLPGRSVLADLAAAKRIETVGLTPTLAAAAANPTAGPLTIAPAGVDTREVLKSTPASHRVSLTVEVKDLAALLDDAMRWRGSQRATLAQPHAPVLRVAGELPELASREPVHVCLDAATASDALHPGHRAAVVALLAEGTPTKTAAAALAELTGWSRRRAYDVVLDIARSSA